MTRKSITGGHPFTFLAVALSLCVVPGVLDFIVQTATVVGLFAAIYLGIRIVVGLATS